MTEAFFEPHDIAGLRQALASAAPGARVRLGAGRFLLDQTLSIAHGVEIAGEPGKTILDGQKTCGILVVNGGDAVGLSGLTFENGMGAWGGAISSGVRTRLLIERCRFAGNRATEDGGAVFVRAAAASRIVCCVFEGNAAARGGGALDVGNGADVLVDRCMFHGNQAKVGGAVFLNGTGALELRNCTFVENRAGVTPGGGGLFVRGAASSGPSAYVANSVFAGRDVIAGDPSTKYDVYFTHSVVPSGAIGQGGLQDLGTNTIGTAELVELPGGLWALAPGSKGTRAANPARVDEGATDLLGRPVVRNGVADPGALAVS